MVDKYIEGLLNRWGKFWFSEDLGYPHECVYCKLYRAKGYRSEPYDPIKDEAHRLAEFMPIHLSPLRIGVLRVRYRKNIRHKRKAAKHMGISERRYREYYNDAVGIIEARFI